MSDPKPHAIVIPYPFHGHLTPTINLATKLASNGFTVTCVLPEFIHHSLSNYQLMSEGVRYTAVSDGFSLQYNRDLNFEEYWETMIRDFPDRVDQVVRSIKTNDGGAATEFFLVADSLYTWTADVATKHGLVNVSFWTTSALVFSILYHLDLLAQNGHFPFQGSSVDIISYIPGVESISTNNLMSHLQQPHVVPILNKIVKIAFNQVKKAHFILCNTVQELESPFLSALNQLQPTYSVGPINFSAKTGPHLHPGSDCSAWLQSKPPASVLYISFGSIFEFKPREITEIANGLLSSRVDFIWVLKSHLSSAEVLPKGFMDNVDGRGLVVPWCDQNLVLSSSAIGGFVTHCGWNSILESMWNGVPMICHGFYVDQPTNRKLVVDDWKLGIDLCSGEGVARDEVSTKIGDLMKGEMGIQLRQEARKVSKIMRNALEREGSSQINFDQFVADLKGRLKNK